MLLSLRCLRNQPISSSPPRGRGKKAAFGKLSGHTRESCQECLFSLRFTASTSKPLGTCRLATRTVNMSRAKDMSSARNPFYQHGFKKVCTSLNLLRWSMWVWGAAHMEKSVSPLVFVRNLELVPWPSQMDRTSLTRFQAPPWDLLDCAWRGLWCRLSWHPATKGVVITLGTQAFWRVVNRDIGM